MLMITDALPRIKAFRKLIPLPERARELVIRCVVGFLMHLGRMSASQAAGAIRTKPRHRAQICRLFGRQYWSRNILESMQMDLLALEALRGELLFIVDQTYNGQQGQKTENTFSRANYRPRPKKGNRRQKKHAKRSCHCFVMGLLLLPNGVRIPFFRSYYTSEYCKAKGRPYQRQTELAADMIRSLPVSDKAKVVVLGDTAFEADTIRAACAERKFSWVVPLNPERVLAGPKRQRPKVWSLAKELKPKQLVRIDVSPSRGRFVAQRRIARCRLGRKLKSRTYYVHQEKRRVHNVGEVLLVFSTTKAPSKDQELQVQKILMTNDTTWTALAVVERYQLRWQIELFFKELKSTLGMCHYQFRAFDRVEGWVTVALLTFLYLEWYRARQLQRRDMTDKQRKWWQAQRTYGLCQAVRQQAEQSEVESLADALQTKNGIRRMRKILKNSHPAEYRAAA